MKSAALLLLMAASAAAQDPLDLARLKDFRAYRSSSNNPDLTSNDDSLRPIPGETVVLADLRGPGVVTHIWLTIAANEYGWPRLLLLRVYYDGSATPSVDAESLIDLVRTENAKADVQKEVFWSRDLLFLRANGPGARLDIPVEIAADGFYELVAQVAHAPDYGDYRTLLDGQPLEAGDVEHEPGANTGGGTLVRAWGSELYVAEDHLLGWRRLSRGHHIVSFVCAGKDARSDGYHLGIDTIVVAKVASPEKTTAPHVPTNVLEMTSMLRSPDAILRGVPALALRDLGSGAREALPALAQALKDPEVAVRMTAADAAQPALPVLAELEKIPRVGPAATTAMRCIRGR